MRIMGPGFEFRMKLAPQEPWIIRDLNNLHQFGIGAHAGNFHAVFLKNIDESIVELIAVPMTLGYFFYFVGL